MSQEQIGLREILSRVNVWLSGHWRSVMGVLVLLLLMQQCTINRLWGVVERDREAVVEEPSNVVPVEPGVDEGTAPVVGGDVEPAEGVEEGVTTQGTAGGEVQTPWLLYGAIFLALLGIIYLVLRRKGIYPFGMSLRGDLKKSAEGSVLFTVRVRNLSAIDLEVADPMICFHMSELRKFRASLDGLPITLAPGTSYEQSIQLQRLIESNVELRQASGISMSLLLNGDRHATGKKRV